MLIKKIEAFFVKVPYFYCCGLLEPSKFVQKQPTVKYTRKLQLARVQIFKTYVYKNNQRQHFLQTCIKMIHPTNARSRQDWALSLLQLYA